MCLRVYKGCKLRQRSTLWIPGAVLGVHYGSWSPLGVQYGSGTELRVHYKSWTALWVHYGSGTALGVHYGSDSQLWVHYESGTALRVHYEWCHVPAQTCWSRAAPKIDDHVQLF